MSEDTKEVETAVEVPEVNVKIDFDVEAVACEEKHGVIKYILKNKNSFAIDVKIYLDRFRLDELIILKANSICTVRYYTNYDVLFEPTLPRLPPQ